MDQKVELMDVGGGLRGREDEEGLAGVGWGLGRVLKGLCQGRRIDVESELFYCFVGLGG